MLEVHGPVSLAEKRTETENFKTKGKMDKPVTPTLCASLFFFLALQKMKCKGTKDPRFLIHTRGLCMPVCYTFIRFMYLMVFRYR